MYCSINSKKKFYSDRDRTRVSTLGSSQRYQLRHLVLQLVWFICDV